jgi:hypothetical protein
MSAGIPGALGPDGTPLSPLDRIRAAVEEIERKSRADEVRDRARTAELAAAARRGELGPEWRSVQSRVDRGETTLHDVFTGKDESPAAAALARRSRENVVALAANAREDEDVTEAAEELDVVRARLAERELP